MARLLCHYSLPLADDLARHRAARSIGPRVLAFGLHSHGVRCIADHVPRLGGVRPLHRPLHMPPADALAWVHRASGPLGLASPWTSHRDLLGVRRADWFDPRPLAALLAHLHTQGARPAWPRPAIADLPTLFRVASECRGWLPGDRRSFATFAHMAHARGVPTASIARALGLTPRRVRQLLAKRAPDRSLAERALRWGAVSTPGVRSPPVPARSRCTLRPCDL